MLKDHRTHFEVDEIWFDFSTRILNVEILWFYNNRVKILFRKIRCSYIKRGKIFPYLDGIRKKQKEN